jgi:hypothetical protein
VEWHTLRLLEEAVNSLQEPKRGDWNTKKLMEKNGHLSQRRPKFSGARTTKGKISKSDKDFLFALVASCLKYFNLLRCLSIVNATKSLFVYLQLSV